MAIELRDVMSEEYIGDVSERRRKKSARRSGEAERRVIGS